jgi:O-antigen ligase
MRWKSAQPDIESRDPVGSVGIVVLYAMWLFHMLLFRGDGLVTWIGLTVVVQNIFTSLFNSHIFDFHKGWMYV